MPKRQQRVGHGIGAITVAILTTVLLAGCTGDQDEPEAAASSSPPPAAGVQTPLDPTEVPPIETEPPVIPTDEPGRQDSVLDRLPGEAGSGCVAVNDERDVRSGTMAAGNFAEARAQYSDSAESEMSFYFIPAALEGDPELVIRLTQVNGSGEKEIRSAAIETADEWRFYPVRFAIPEEGTWRIEATAGDENRGCWEATFQG
ncbi:hypothetical protein [Microbacterium sp. NPDC058345]|uniref:hypothetical protein n=1 Tax=Microbacterium sp. NPDC058345 TaxID=3346455 RepID=UPI003652BC36